VSVHSSTLEPVFPGGLAVPKRPPNGGKIAESATFSCRSGPKVHGFVALSAIKNEDGVSDPGYGHSKALLDVGNGRRPARCSDKVTYSDLVVALARVARPPAP
jgi:hypothetical protein